MNTGGILLADYVRDPEKLGRVFSFIDFGNVRAWAKDLWPHENKDKLILEIDITALGNLCALFGSIKRILYYGFFPLRADLPSGHWENKKANGSFYRLKKARRAGFDVVSKEIKMIRRDGEKGLFPKCNFDVEITMDMLTKIERYDTVLLFSGDSDFHGLLNYLKAKSKKIVIVCTRPRMSTELKKVADIFIPAERFKDFLQKNTPPG